MDDIPSLNERERIISRIAPIVEQFCFRVLSDKEYRNWILAHPQIYHRGHLLHEDPKITISLTRYHYGPKVINIFLGRAVYEPVPGRYHIEGHTADLALIRLASDIEPFYRSIREWRCIMRYG